MSTCTGCMFNCDAFTYRANRTLRQQDNSGSNNDLRSRARGHLKCMVRVRRQTLPSLNVIYNMKFLCTGIVKNFMCRPVLPSVQQIHMQRTEVCIYVHKSSHIICSFVTSSIPLSVSMVIACISWLHDPVKIDSIDLGKTIQNGSVI